jgi:hypothetical protein
MVVRLLNWLLSKLLGFDVLDELEDLKNKLEKLKDYQSEITMLSQTINNLSSKVDLLKLSKFVIPQEVSSIQDIVENLVKEAELSPLSSRWKRVQVTRRLLQQGIKERDAALAIELAVRSIK